MKTILTLIICVSLGVSARAQLTSQQLKDYVRNTWQITDLSDSAIASTLDTSFSGIPFKDWINGLDTAFQVNEQLQKQNYAEASKIAVGFASEVGFNSLLEQAGLDGVASVAQLAEWPIQYALNDFVNTVQQKTFRDQCARYFAVRAHNTAEQISSAAPFALLDADVNGGLLYKDGQGWLIRVTGYTTTGSVLGFNSSTQFYALAEKLWQAREQTKNLADESRDVASAFRQAATPSAPVITSSPNAQTITEGQTATFSVAATGSGTLTYRWRRDGVIVNGLTASSFTTDVAGCYQAEVINSVGSVFSATACLTVQPVQAVSLTVPSAGATLAGSVTVRASANAATKVEFWLDGVRKATDSTSPYSWTWDTSGSGDGTHQLIAKAYNGMNLLGSTAGRTVTVDNTSAGNCSDPTEPNNTSTTGTWLPPGSSTNAYICTASDVDWFRIPVTTAGLMNITVVVPAGLDFDLELYGTDGTWQAGSYHGVGQIENITFNVSTPGTYYARVYGYPFGNGSHSTTATYTITTAKADLTNSLVAYYPFNGNANDESGHGNNGLASNIVFASNRFGFQNSCAVFNGINSIVNVPTLASFQYTPATYSAWVKLSSFMPSRIVNAQISMIVGRDRACDGPEGALCLYTESQYGINNQIGYYTGAEILYMAGQLNLNAWTHLVVTIDQTNRATIYCNGTVVASKQLTVNSTSQFPLTIGGSAPTICPPNEHQDWWNGEIDDVRIYNRALSASEVQQLYSAENISPQADSGDNLLAYYPFNGNAHDESGNGNNGVVYGGAVLTTNRFGAANSAYDFDGSTSYIRVPDSDSLELTNDFTLSTWIMPRSLYGGFLSKHISGLPNNGTWIFQFDNGNSLINFAATPYFDPSVESATVPALGHWHHLVFSYVKASQVWKIYLDGALNNGGTRAYDIRNNDRDLTIGAEEHPSYPQLLYHFNGIIDDIRIYKRAVSASEIQDLYNNFEGQQIAATLTVLAQPASHRSSVGDSTAFSVTASGTGTLGYQWQRNGADIPGATGATYTTPPLSLADSGALYLVRVTNAFDSLFSAPAVLTVTIPRISNPLLTINGNIQFDVNSDDTRPHIIEVSTNLVNWSSIATNTPVNGVITFSNAVTSGLRQRFYRAVVR